MNSLFDFTEPPVDPRLVSPEGQLRPPINGRSPEALAHSQAGADAVQPHVMPQMRALLDAYLEHGPLCDADAEDATGIQRSSVTPRRRALMLRGLVYQVGEAVNRKSGLLNTTFGLTDQGRVIAERQQ